jgi:hypothetical protein
METFALRLHTEFPPDLPIVIINEIIHYLFFPCGLILIRKFHMFQLLQLTGITKEGYARYSCLELSRFSITPSLEIPVLQTPEKIGNHHLIYIKGTSMKFVCVPSLQTWQQIVVYDPSLEIRRIFKDENRLSAWEAIKPYRKLLKSYKRIGYQLNKKK